MVIVDTTVWVDYFRGLQNAETDWLNAEVSRQRLGLTDLILWEVLQGVPDDVALKRSRCCTAIAISIRSKKSSSCQ